MPARPELVGREHELTEVRRWAARLADGPAALVVQGEPGIGKTSLWAAATDLASSQGAQVLVSRPVEAEMPLGYAGLGDLLETVAAEVLPRLPPTLSAHLGAALLLGPVVRPEDPLAVGRAVLGALRVLAEDSAVVLAVDDVQWLDPASTRALAFAARRLSTERVGLLLAARPGVSDPVGAAAALGERSALLSVGPLSLGAVAHLVRTRVAAQTPRRAVALVHERSAGNPFHALELARHLGADGLPATLRLAVEERLRAAGPAATAAVEEVAVRGPCAAATLSDAESVRAAVAGGLLADDTGLLRFTHPLLATAAYARTSPARRRELHRRASDAAAGVEDRARHLALATDAPDETTAGVLDEAARTAAARGAPDAAAELAAQAARLTPPGDPAARLSRLTDQVDHLVRAGDEALAAAVVEEVLADGAAGDLRVRALVHAALLARAPQTAVTRLEEAALGAAGDARLHAGTLAQLAWQRGAWAGDVAAAYPEAVRAVALAREAADPATLVHALTVAGMMGTILGEPAAELSFRQALAIVADDPGTRTDRPPRVAYAHVLFWRGDWPGAEQLLAEERAVAERTGDDGVLMRLDVFGADLAARRGQWHEADRLLAAALGEARDYWRVTALLQRGLLRARRGDRAAAEDAAEVAASPLAAADPVVSAGVDHVRGLLAVAEGDRRAAADLMLRLPRTMPGAGVRALEIAAVLPESVLALVDAGRAPDAAPLVAALESRPLQLGAWGAAAADLGRGLLETAGGDLELAAARIARGRAGFDELTAPWQLGLALLAEGSVLRRLGRRSAAATCLERAVDVLGGLGAQPARDRASQELARARPRPAPGTGPTAAERRVAALVAEGLSNKEVAAALSTSVATVEAHLTRIYSKVGVRSRTQLARLVADGSLEVGP